MVKNILRGTQHLVGKGLSHGLLDRPSSIGAVQPGPWRLPAFILNNFHCERKHGPDEDMDQVAKGELRAVIRLLKAFAYEKWLPLGAIEYAVETLQKIDEVEWDGWDGCAPAEKLGRAADRFAEAESGARLAIDSEIMPQRPMTFETLQEAQEEARLHGPRWELVLVDPETFQILFLGDD
ncbi:hypothetical protein GGTG_05529 [Gaeumannomyces tritici R3-111a-1]|uniref:Uncharacterized protein n=1 Tax=Gaeumannomyces tritici (strain R3-111a-1) TaxID=644352 RepID=J3NW64_GAET3|nr:hypothetical protein GGTG_05529 [Gaeumannomyces tritici R3-111a-1]EJT75596.1 hypothetical protein GGTG_05529 [Gaeumannomyces tritici R3-111a-1]